MGLSGEIVVAFQGEMGAFSETAARAYFHEKVSVVPHSTFSALFESVEDGRCTHGVAPIENSLAGSIHENYDLLLRHDLRIVGELKLRVVHNLIVNPGVKLEDVRRIFSHPQALAQCSVFIKSLENADAIVDYDTAGAVKRIKTSGARTDASIASAQAALDYDLEILRPGIENNHQNFTRFLVVSKEAVKPKGPAKTSVVYALKNEPGALFRSLGLFEARNINLLKIESRPLDGRPWEYAFHLDFSGDLAETGCLQAIRSLKEMSTFLKILGSYDQGETVEGKVRQKGVS